MPRPKTDALIELSEWMEQAHQLQSALVALDRRIPAFRSKKKAAAKSSKQPAKCGADPKAP